MNSTLNCFINHRLQRFFSSSNLYYIGNIFGSQWLNWCSLFVLSNSSHSFKNVGDTRNCTTRHANSINLVSHAWIILGVIYSPWAILRGLQKFSGLFSYMERVFSAIMYSPIFIRKKINPIWIASYILMSKMKKKKVFLS